MAAAIDIRLAHAGDIDALVELAGTTFRETYSDDDPGDIDVHVARHFNAAAFAAILADPAMTLQVASARGRLVGYLQVKDSTPPPCVTGPRPIELARLYLRREAIGQGLGAALMRAAHADARARGGQTLWLVVYAKNDAARAFYARCGFVDVGFKDFRFGDTVFSDPVMVTAVRDA